MRTVLLSLFALALAASASAQQPRLIGHVAAGEVAAITAAVRADTADRIVEIRAGAVTGPRVNVQTEAGSSAGCRYLVERTEAGTWRILGKSCWTHVSGPVQEDPTPRPPPAPTRPPQLPEADFEKVLAAVRAATTEPITAVHTITLAKPMAGAIERKASTLDIVGPGQTRWREIVVYERTDQVGVMTGDSRKLTGDSYLIGKHGDTWKIEKRDRWMR